MTKYLLTIWLGLAPLLSLAQAESDVDDLLASLAPIKHLQGSFSQQQYGQDNLLLAESSGKFRLLRPGYFSWEILNPDEQLIIAGPEFIWHYDRDLETVTRRPVTSNAEMTPLQILGGDESALREKFQVVRKAEGALSAHPTVGRCRVQTAHTVYEQDAAYGDGYPGQSGPERGDQIC